jgi:aminoglycoside phosphotransferase (APT) family kinase protein
VATRDLVHLRQRLAAWLATRLGEGSDPVISDLVVPEANGMSSDTFLFDITRTVDGRSEVLACVGRMEPEATATPVFPSYDFSAQAQAMRLVAAHCDAPVPTVHFLEEDRSVLGSPFLVMGRIDGRVPPDVMPYTFEGWLLEATAADRRRLQDETVRCMAQVHTLTADRVDLSAFAARVGSSTIDDGASPLRRHVAATRDYARWIAGGRRLPLIEASFEWLDEHWPEVEAPASLSWGDARIGNIIYRGFEPVALLDWEMAGIAPPEVDLGWCVFMHRFFQDIAEQMELPGVPDLLRLDDVVATYEAASGHRPTDMAWFVTYAALRHATVMTRVAERMARDEGNEIPEDPDELIMHRATLEQMLEGTYRLP